MRGLFCCGKCFLQKPAPLRDRCVYSLYDSFLVRSDAPAVVIGPLPRAPVADLRKIQSRLPVLLAVYSIYAMQELTLHGTATCSRSL